MELLGIGIVRILSKVTYVALFLDIIFLIFGVVIDIAQKRFHWSKYSLIALGIILIMLIIEIKITYQIVSDTLK